MFSANGSTDTNPSLAIYERASRVCNMSCLYSHTHTRKFIDGIFFYLWFVCCDLSYATASHDKSTVRE